MTDFILPSSFRDPCGFLYQHDGIVLRQVNHIYQENYDHLMKSGLYAQLVKNSLLIPHEELAFDRNDAYKILRPLQLDFVSYPYEWCFSALKEAALTTLAVQKIALAHGMTLKDASAYNIQFVVGKATFIDTLSFETLAENQPWVAYKQFCQHFLAPLLLASYNDMRLVQLMRVHIDGIPLDLASKLLPKRTYARFSVLAHIHLHAKSQKRYAGRGIDKHNRRFSLTAFKGLIDNLEQLVTSLEWNPDKTEWGSYYEDTNYSSEAFDAKKTIISRMMAQAKPASIWDIGANTGVFSRLTDGTPTISFDMDPLAVETNYVQCKKENRQNILPLLLDLTNPSPALGWAGRERMSFNERGPADMVLALALVHHLAIANNVPLYRIASFFADIGEWLVIEFIPKDDSQVQKLLASRKDVFNHYTQAEFESAMNRHFVTQESAHIPTSKRTLYLMRRR